METKYFLTVMQHILREKTLDVQMQSYSLFFLVLFFKYVDSFIALQVGATNNLKHLYLSLSIIISTVTCISTGFAFKG